MAHIVLSSSPSCSPIAITPPHTAAAPVSSSPGLPSPSVLFTSMGPSLVSGSRATPIPADAVAGFASASTLLRRARSIDETGSPSNIKTLGLSERHDWQSSGKVVTPPRELGGEKEKEKVPVFKEPRALHKNPSEIIQEKATHAAAVQSANFVDNPGILAPKKSRKKKNKDGSEAQTTIKKTKITKPGAIRSGKKAITSTKKAKEAISAPLRPASTQEEDLRAKEEFRDLCQEKAIPRRKEWTPCKDTAPDPILSEGLEKLVDPKLLNINSNLANEPQITRFGSLLGNFGFIQKEGNSVVTCDTTRQGNGEGMVKRRKIELVNGVPAPRFPEKPKRCKSPRKKPQTVTEKATAPFAPAKSMDAPSLLQFFGASATAESVTPARSAPCNPDTSLTAGRRSPVKKTATSKPKTKIKKPVQKQPILLSPESAMKNARNQELIFGTSSQLAREESPSFIRDLQQAMKESEPTAEQEQGRSKDFEFLDLPSGRSRSSNVQAIKASRSLWSAASRDINGSLVEVEMVDLADSPKPFCMVAKSANVTGKSAASESRLLSNEVVEQSHESQGVSVVANLSLDTSPALQQQLQEQESGMPRSVAEAALRARPKSKPPAKKTSAGKPAMNQMPNYEGFTDVQLRKEVTLNGFKRIKKREEMIALLGQCWESRTSMALQEVPANVSLLQPAKESINADGTEQSSPFKKRGRPPKVLNPTAMNGAKDDNASPKRPRGRPKKDANATTPQKRKPKAKSVLSEATVSAADDDIYDSSPPTPSPPRRRSPPKSLDQLPLSLPLGTSTTNANIANTTVKAMDRVHIFSQITRAVTTFPPSHDPKSPTWYEKILMYDPIVLEDLTIWLNTEGLGKIGEDDEVWPGLVKEWCEERSVCCLWRENLRGGARGRW